MDWRKFEDLVADFFKLFGYTVVQNTRINSAQTDVIATSTSRFKPTLLIECKYHQNFQSKVSIDDVENFQARVITLRTAGKVDQGYLVTNTGFTEAGKESNQSLPYVHLLTYNELFYQFIDVEYYLKEFIENYRKKHLNNYVQLRCTDIIHMKNFDFKNYIKGKNYLSDPNVFKLVLTFSDKTVHTELFSLSIIDDFISYSSIVEKVNYKAFSVLDIVELSDDNSYRFKSGFEYVSNDLRAGISVSSHLVKDALAFEETLRQSITDDKFSEIVMFKKETVTNNDREKERLKIDQQNPFLEDYFSNFLKNSERLLLLLGDFGSGKSTTLAHLMYHQAIKKVENPYDPTLPIPIFLSLKNYSKYLDLESMLVNFFETELGFSNINLKAFKKMNEMGLFLIFLDGFDEMSRLVTAVERRLTFKEISGFVTDKNKVVLSCRPGYFSSNLEISKLIRAYLPSEEEYESCGIIVNKTCQILCLQLLDSKKIEEFIYKNVKTDPQIIIELAQSRSISDLASRPVLLKIIIDTYKEISYFQRNNQISLKELYDLYTEKWINREEDKGTFRLLIDPEKKLTFVKLLAVQMHEEQKLFLHFSELDELIKSYFDITGQDRVDNFSNDLRTCSFLSRDDNGNYHFMHKSFMEYFVAKEFNSFSNPSYNSPFNVPFNSEIRDFISIGDTEVYKLQEVIDKASNLKKYFLRVSDYAKLQSVMQIEDDFMLLLQKNWPRLIQINDVASVYLQRLATALG